MIAAANNRISTLPLAETGKKRGIGRLSSLPPNLQVLRLGGNPLTTKLFVSPGLWSMLQQLQYLQALSLTTQTDALPNSDSNYLLTMPGIQTGVATCTSRLDLASSVVSAPIVPAAAVAPFESPLAQQLLRAAAACPFSISAGDPQAGGLEIHWCLNTTAGCACDVGVQDPHATLPSTCVPLVDGHNGYYHGALDGRLVGDHRQASYRFYRRSHGSGSVFEEVVVGRWSDGSSCVGANCFAGVRFEADCSAHGPFAVVVNTEDTTRCECPAGYKSAAAPDGRWQCEKQQRGKPDGSDGGGSEDQTLCTSITHQLEILVVVALVALAVCVGRPLKLRYDERNAAAGQQMQGPSASTGLRDALRVEADELRVQLLESARVTAT